MYIKIRDKKTKEVTTIRTQQYTCGLYVIENDDPSRQYSLDTNEKELLKNLKNDDDIEIIKKI
jgi:hypothetical protein